MTRNLKILGLTLMAVMTLNAMTASSSIAEVKTSALFTAEVGASEFAKIDGSQLNTNTLNISGAAGPMTCTETPIEGKVLTAGKSSTKVTLRPEYNTCHVKVGVLTRTLTVTVNSCAYVLNATTTDGTTFKADATIECPTGKQIEIHVYSTSNHNDSGISVLCTYDVEPQENLQSIELTNKAGGINDIVAHLAVNITVTATILSGTCGLQSHTTGTLSGETTLRATDEEANFVDAEVSG